MSLLTQHKPREDGNMTLGQGAEQIFFRYRRGRISVGLVSIWFQDKDESREMSDCNVYSLEPVLFASCGSVQIMLALGFPNRGKEVTYG
eukprot:14256000-Ditylum_brightwellii.AAC.1